MILKASSYWSIFVFKNDLTDTFGSYLDYWINFAHCFYSSCFLRRITKNLDAVIP